MINKLSEVSNILEIWLDIFSSVNPQRPGDSGPAVNDGSHSSPESSPLISLDPKNAIGIPF